MYKKLVNKLTNDKKEIPLIYVTLDLEKFKQSKHGSCEAKVHPSFCDEEVKRKVNELIDYIRDNFDVEKLI